VKSPRARQKIRQWFNARAIQESVAAGRAQVEKELRRARAVNANLEQLASKLGFKQPDDLFAAVARDEVNLRQLHSALHGDQAPAEQIEVPKGKKICSRQRWRAGRGNGQPSHPARPLLQAGAAGSGARLRHARQGRVGAPRRLRGAEAPGGSPARTPYRRKLG
jgi:hypothetical protein